MTYNSANCVQSTNSFTRVSTFLVNASQMTGTFCITDAFWSAVWWRTDEFGEARTGRSIIHCATLRIGATRRRLARVFWYWWKFRCNFVLKIFFFEPAKFVLRISKHLVKGSPVKPGRQLQIGLWFTTWHTVATPQVPGHGSMHFWLTQALFKEHSELVTHSGLQVGGLPIKPGTHEQTAC